MISNKGREWRRGQTGHVTRESTRRGGRRGMVCYILQMLPNTQASLPTMKSMVMEYMSGQMEECTRGIGSKTK